MKQAEFFFDFGSPASYLASTQMDGLAQRAGAQIIWRPMLLGGVFKATGNASPAAIPAKARWMMTDFQRFAKRYNVEFAFNPYFPLNTLQLMRCAAALELEGALRPFADSVFRALWVEKKNMGDPAIVESVLAKNGFNLAALGAKAESPAAKERLKTSTEEAVARGVFGAPTFFVGDAMFFGQDRLDFVEDVLRA